MSMFVMEMVYEFLRPEINLWYVMKMVNHSLSWILFPENVILQIIPTKGRVYFPSPIIRIAHMACQKQCKQSWHVLAYCVCLIVAWMLRHLRYSCSGLAGQLPMPRLTTNWAQNKWIQLRSTDLAGKQNKTENRRTSPNLHLNAWLLLKANLSGMQ